MSRSCPAAIQRRSLQKTAPSCETQAHLTGVPVGLWLTHVFTAYLSIVWYRAT